MPPEPTSNEEAPGPADASPGLPASHRVTVTVYWRPGCGFCAALKGQLARAGLPTTEINIWEDEEAAAFVRSHARGNETVPTVDIGGEVLVNPPATKVVTMARDAGLEFAPSESGTNRLRRFLGR